MTSQLDFLARLALTAAPVVRPVDVPGWGRVYVRALTVAEVDAASDDMRQEDKSRRFARGAARVLCDEHGARLLNPADDTHIDLLARQPWSLLQMVLATADAKDDGPVGN